MPNFLVIGAPRSGTSALYRYLKQHPQIYMSPIKETQFFASEKEKHDFSEPDYKMITKLTRRSVVQAKITDIATFRALFQAVSDETAIGEASPIYLFHPKAPERIHHYIPNAKMIAILRDPVERAYSDYVDQVANRGWALEDFDQTPQTIQVEKNWWSNWRRYGYILIGFYHRHLKRYFDMFDRDQIRVYLYRDFKINPVSVLRDSFQFLGVNERFVPDMSVKYGVTGIPRSRLLYILLTRPNPLKDILRPYLPTGLRQRVNNLRIKNLVKPQLAPEVRREWLQVYREDILQLQDLIQRDLSSWLE